KGEEIPMTARIFTVVDCYDSARTDRKFRKGLSRDKALALLADCAGSVLDPNVVRVFCKHLPEFEAEISRKNLQEYTGEAAHPASFAPSQQHQDGPDAYEHIRNAQREVNTLYDIAQTIGTSLDLRDVFAIFASRLQDIVSYTTCIL